MMMRPEPQSTGHAERRRDSRRRLDATTARLQSVFTALFEVYARFAATALDGAAALMEAQRHSELLDRLSGVAAQATTALQNGRLLDELTQEAMHDQLTGLANTLRFTRELRDAISRAREQISSITLLYMDLDRFKPVNDEFGHDVGDQLLVAVAKRLRSCTRAEDALARLGGDEFAVLIDSQTAPVDAEAISDRLAGALTRPFLIDGHHLQLGVSIGRAVFPIDADDADGLLRCADAAMIAVKRDTRARAVNSARGR